MRNFELTERGKIVLAVIIVIPILILSIILAILAFSGDPPNPSSPDAKNEGLTQDQIEILIEPPDNGGFPPPDDEDEFASQQPPDIAVDPSDNDAPDEADDNNNEDTDLPDDIGSPTVNLTAGTFTFYFSINHQSAPDRESLILLDMFLSSSKNKPDSIIAIITPRLSADDNTAFMTIMTSVLGERNIPSDRIMQIIDPAIPLGEFFEINMSYIDKPETK